MASSSPLEECQKNKKKLSRTLEIYRSEIKILHDTGKMDDEQFREWLDFVDARRPLSSLYCDLNHILKHAPLILERRAAGAKIPEDIHAIQELSPQEIEILMRDEIAHASHLSPVKFILAKTSPLGVSAIRAEEIYRKLGNILRYDEDLGALSCTLKFLLSACSENKIREFADFSLLADALEKGATDGGFKRALKAYETHLKNLLELKPAFTP